MSRKPLRHGTKWTPKNVRRLRKLANENASTKRIAKELGRTEAAIRSKASEKRVSLKPKD